jgi:hypothetical protein
MKVMEVMTAMKAATLAYITFITSITYITTLLPFFLEPTTGIEPVTSSLPRTCSTN